MTNLEELLRELPTEAIDDREVEAQASLRTYNVYIHAFTIKAGKIDDLQTRQDSLTEFNTLQVARKAKLGQIRKPLYRGWLTLRALKVLPVGEYPELATTANYWAPVQAYYAAHGVGSAALLALGDSVPQNHRAFRAAIQNQIVKRLLPFPFNVCCRGNPADKNGIDFRNCSVELSHVRKTSNLESPSASNANALMAKALLTTRSRLLSENFHAVRKTQVKKGKTRRNLSKTEKERIAQKLHPPQFSISYIEFGFDQITTILKCTFTVKEMHSLLRDTTKISWN